MKWIQRAIGMGTHRISPIHSLLSCIKKTHHLSNLLLYNGISPSPSPPSAKLLRCLFRWEDPQSPFSACRPTATRLRSVLSSPFTVGMSRNNGKSPKVELKLNPSLSTMRGNTSRRVADVDDEGSPNNSTSPSSCVSSEGANSPEAASMVLAGCPRCLMYVMLAEADPKCPKCKSTVLLDFHNDNNSSKKNRKS